MLVITTSLSASPIVAIVITTVTQHKPCPMAKQTDLASSLTAVREATSSSSSSPIVVAIVTVKTTVTQQKPDSRGSPIVAILITTVTQRKPDSRESFKQLEKVCIAVLTSVPKMAMYDCVSKSI